nr:hypothetical protein [Solanum melongena]WMB96899.1 hypothetical protein [Solanum melongena]WMB97089.1 hypothetical protein [Solanum aethiopicum]
MVRRGQSSYSREAIDGDHSWESSSQQERKERSKRGVSGKNPLFNPFLCLGEQWSQGCLWPEFTRYALDSNNKLITGWSLSFSVVCLNISGFRPSLLHWFFTPHSPP